MSINLEIEGDIEVISNGTEILIIGNPVGLRSFAKNILNVANCDQENSDIPIGERVHIHLYPKNNSTSKDLLSSFSLPCEICRLDAKGTKDYPNAYECKTILR
jgi:hypothetical protein